jgi:hypothetical protein
VSRTCEVHMYDGQVACPYTASGQHVDVETCYRCPRLRAFHDEESGTMVVCAKPRGIVDGLLASLGSIEARFHR